MKKNRIRNILLSVSLIVGVAATIGYIGYACSRIDWSIPKGPPPLEGKVIHVEKSEEIWANLYDYLYTVKINENLSIQYLNKEARLQRFIVGDIIQVWSWSSVEDCYLEAKLVNTTEVKDVILRDET